MYGAAAVALLAEAVLRLAAELPVASASLAASKSLPDWDAKSTTGMFTVLTAALPPVSTSALASAGTRVNRQSGTAAQPTTNFNT
jgi:hypothetical protein